MLRFLEDLPSPDKFLDAFRVCQHLKLLIAALQAVATQPGRLALYVLAASAAIAVLVVRPNRRSLRTGRRYTAYLVLSWTGHSYETAYCLCDAIEHITLQGWLVLASVTRALLVYLSRQLPLFFIIRTTSWTSLLLFSNRVALVLWHAPRIWHVLHICGFLGSLLSIAGSVALTITLTVIPLALYMPLCALQDSISAWRVRRTCGPDGNAQSAAANLPAEVQLLIFHLLRTRGRFGAHEHLARDTHFNHDPTLIPFSGARDLAATARVCIGWRAAATEALYRDAVFRSGTDTCQFSRALEAQPALAPLVRRIVLAEWVKYTPSEESEYDTPLPTLSAAIEHLMTCCVNVTDVRLFRDTTPALADIPGLRSTGLRASQLRVESGFTRRFPPGGTVHEPEDVDLHLLLSFLPRLKSLTLTRQRVLFDSAVLDDAHGRSLRGINGISLGECMLDLQHLVRLLHHLPNLRAAELRNAVFSDAHGLISVADLFATQLRTLVDLRLLVLAALPRDNHRIIFHSFCSFLALRTLTVNAHMLSAIAVLPPSLRELIVSFAPYTCHAHSRYSAQPHCLRSLLSAASNVRALASEAPTLRAVQLWDHVHLAQLAPWSVTAFMLREMLGPAGVTVYVNLFVAAGDNLMLKDKFSTRKVIRRILWQGVV